MGFWLSLTKPTPDTALLPQTSATPSPHLLALKIVTSSQPLSCTPFPALQIVLQLVAFLFPLIRGLSRPHSHSRLCSPPVYAQLSSQRLSAPVCAARAEAAIPVSLARPLRRDAPAMRLSAPHRCHRTQPPQGPSSPHAHLACFLASTVLLKHHVMLSQATRLPDTCYSLSLFFLTGRYCLTHCVVY